MFEQRKHETTTASAIGTLELIYVSTVRSIRKGHSAGGLGLLANILQTVVLIGIFFFMFSLLGLRGSAIRGDFMLYVMSGVFLYITHIKTVGGVFSSDGPTSPMMRHAPMNTIVAIVSAAIGQLYLQLLSIFVILFIYHAAVTPITIHQPIGALFCVIMAWFSGAAVGVVFLAARPWAAGLVSTVKTVYMRANMLASGKMFVANSLPFFMLPFFTWNPLFHIIDQARGYTFLNYNPHFTTLSYPIIVSLVLIMVGLMGDFFTRKHASLSWSAR